MGSIEKSLPVRGAWIEICWKLLHVQHMCWSLPVRGAWIEMFSGRSISTR